MGRDALAIVSLGRRKKERKTYRLSIRKHNNSFSHVKGSKTE